MTKLLSQDEIDQLLTAITDGSVNALTTDRSVNTFNSIENFEQYLTKRTFTPEKPYGIFD